MSASNEVATARCMGCSRHARLVGRKLCAVCYRRLRYSEDFKRQLQGAYSGGRPRALESAHGYELETLYDADAEAEERGRRVEEYARQVVQHGEIRWGMLPPKWREERSCTS